MERSTRQGTPRRRGGGVAGSLPCDSSKDCPQSVTKEQARRRLETQPLAHSMLTRKELATTPRCERRAKILFYRSLPGAQGRNRTTDTVIFSHVLYQLSYLGAGCGGGGVPGRSPEGL